MIRRWSYINQLSNNLKNFNVFEKRFKLKTFRLSVSYKKYTFKVTKFKRKSLIRFKHTGNWLIYTNVFKLWSKDYMFNKHYVKFQYFNKIFLNNFLFYDFNFTKNRNETVYSNFNFFFSILSKKSYFYFFKQSFKHIKYFSLTFAWFLEKPLINQNIVPFFNTWGNNFYLTSAAKLNDGNLSEMFSFFFFLILIKNVELKKILILFFYTIISKC